jgi:hypothetical protein
MDINTFFSQFAVGNAFLIFAVGALTVLSLFLILTVVRQKQQITTIQADRSRHGFLGKPLYAAVVFALFVGGFGLTYFASQNVQNVTVKADSEVEITIQVKILGASSTGTQVQFNVVPMVDGVEWAGVNGPEFDAFWTAIGPTEFSQIELSLTKSNAGGFIKVLRAGSYEITVDIIVNGNRFNKTATIII